MSSALFWQAYGAGHGGSFEGADAVIAALRQGGAPLDRAGATVLRAQRWFADPAAGVGPDYAVAASFLDAEAEVRAVAGLLCAMGQRVALLAFDRASFDRWLDLHASMTVTDPASESEIWLSAGQAWRAILDGDAEQAAPHIQSLKDRATETRNAAALIEAAVLEAMRCEVEGDFASAVTAARRASRMGRTEVIPQQEYLANVVLARMRRLSGKPHLSSLILSALRRYAPAPWKAWLHWEHGCCAQADPDWTVAESRVAFLREVILAAALGRRPAFDQTVASVGRSAAGVSFAARDLDCLRVLLDPEATTGGDEVQAWAVGASTATPRGFHGVAGNGDRSATAFALGLPGSRGRRVLAPGAALATTERGAEPLGPSRQSRTDSTIAALALRGPEGFEESELFLFIYGFSYISDKHRTVRSMLYRRVRERLPAGAEMVREDGQVRLIIEAPLLIPDPRCAQPGDHTILRLLARLGSLSPKDAARRLGIPIRTAQHALKALAEDGVCLAAKEGRAVTYTLEDTTFSEPTVV